MNAELAETAENALLCVLSGFCPSTLREPQGGPEQSRGTTSSGHPEPVEGCVDRRLVGAGIAGLLPAVSRHRVALGKTGEDLACRELERRGYAVVARRYRCRGGELDIIARDGATLVFVEVKARGGHAFGEAAEAVTAQKQRRIARLALEYVMRHHLVDCPCRFDVVSIHFAGDRPVIEVYQGAFETTNV